MGTRSSSEATSLEQSRAPHAGNCLLRWPTPDHQWDPVSTQILVRGGSLSVPELTEGRSPGKQAGHSFGVKDLHGIWGSGFPGLGKELPK